MNAIGCLLAFATGESVRYLVELVSREGKEGKGSDVWGKKLRPL